MRISEHIRVSGNVKYIHLPYREENGFTWCRNCKKYAGRLTIYFDESPFSDGMQVICGKCKKTIYVADISKRKYAKKDVKCFSCGKKMSRFDVLVSTYFCNVKGVKHFCSAKCVERGNKMWKDGMIK